MTDPQGFVDRMNGLPKYVVASGGAPLAWHPSQHLTGNLAEEVTRLKQQAGQDLLVEGSATLVRSLLRHHLVDEIRLMIYPVVVGPRPAAV
jgi:dihydrofolate reductase